MAFTLPYTDLYTTHEVAQRLKGFIGKWKGCNFLRIQQVLLEKYLTDEDLSVATSAKKPQEYTLYRGLRGYTCNGGIYKDIYPSSWSLNPNIARRFGSSTRSLLLKATIACDKILIDLTLFNDTESEVIVLPGEHACEVLEENLPVRKPVVDIELSILTAGSDIDKLKVALTKHTIPQLKALCKSRNIVGYSNKRKADLVHFTAQRLLG
jgi:hypothetical protein